MTNKLSSVSFDLAATLSRQSQATERVPHGRFNVIVIGDLTGRANRGTVEPLTARKLVNVDVDNGARVFSQLGAKLRLTGPAIPEGAIELAFASLEDFHPDNLLAHVPGLAKLTEARRMMLNPATAEQGNAALQAQLGAVPARPAAEPPLPATGESDDDTMARLLGGTPPASVKSPAPASQVEQLIREAIAPHIVPAPRAWQAGALAAVEMELASQLNAILHHPDFQALEAAWRGVDLLMRRIESSEEIGVLILDASLAELQAGLTANEPATILRLLQDHKPLLLIGNQTFGHSADDLRALGQLAEIAANLRVPFVATAAPQLAGCDSFGAHPDPDDWKTKLPAEVAESWKALRALPHARHAGLAAPRFMARQPYGKRGDAIETFPFEELPGEPAHEAFLWGHPAILVALAAIDALQSGDKELQDFTGGEISDLPMHKFTEEGEVVVKPYAEAWLTDRAVERLIQSGVIPIVPVKNQNAIRLIHFCSIASDPVALRFSA